MFYKSPQFKTSIFLALITFVVFWQLPSHEFVNIDDSVYVTKNPYIKEGLTTDSIKWAFTSFHAEFWHPVTWLSYMLDVEIYGIGPRGFLLTNLLLHITNTILLFIFFKYTTGFLWRSALVASLFAIHPLHVESVAWIAERKDLLSTLFWMLTMLFYVNYAMRPNWKKYITFSLIFLLGLMSKPMLITLPFALLLIDFWPLNRLHLFNKDNSGTEFNRIKLKPAIIEKIPLFIISILFSLITLFAQQSRHGLASADLFPYKTRIANALIAYTSYLRKTFCPFDLAVFYPYKFQVFSWQIILSSFLLISITILVIHRIKRQPYLITGWFWFLGTLFPVIGIIKFGGAFAMADRYTYIPLIGIFIILAWGGHDILSRLGLRRAFRSILVSLLVIMLMATSLMQISYWKNSIALFERALQVTNNNFLAHKNLGRAYIDKGRIDLALPHFKNALRIEPNNPTAHLNVGTCYLFYGEFYKAENYFKKSLELHPNYHKAKINFDKALSAQKNIAIAISILNASIKLNNNDPIPHYNLANLYKQKGNPKKAVFHYKKSLDLEPDYEDAKRGLESITEK